MTTETHRTAPGDLSTTGRRARIVGSVVVLLLVLAGSFAGSDDDFPFGPFRMYATAPDPDAPAGDTRVEGVDTAGRTVVINEANSGVRRAEIEGQQSAYVADPARLARIADAYEQRSPGAAKLREVRIVIRWHGIRHSRPTGTYTDQVVADWSRP